MDKIKIAIVENNQLIADLLKDFLEKVREFHILHVSYSGNSFLEKIDTCTLPDILILDIRMQEGSGIEVIEKLKKLNIDIKILVLSSYYDSHYLSYMFKLGVHAFLPKEIKKEKLVEIIFNLQSDGYYFNRDQMEALQKQIAVKVSSIPLHAKDSLTPREVDVLKLLCYQLTAKAIAEKLFISKKTVETHKSNLLLKTGAKNIAGLIIFAAQNGFININQIFL